VPTDKLFTGRRLDGTGLYYYNARYYDATIGRFISPDPITHSEPLPYGQVVKGLTVCRTTSQFYTKQTRTPVRINPQEYNRYSYALNNPFKYTDTDGHQSYDLYALLMTTAMVAPEVAVVVAIAIVTVTFKDQMTDALSSVWDATKSAAGAIGGFFNNLNPFKDNKPDKNKEPQTKREQLLDRASNDRLRNAINDLYRPGGTVGDGGTADAIRNETQTGLPTGGKWHIEKGMGLLTNLETIMETENLCNQDIEIVQYLYFDLQDAVMGALFP
jgi:hypothetical protein